MKLTYLFGRICSGKSTYKPETRRIMVSDIVRSVINSSDRDKLQNTMHLDDQIIVGLAICIESNIKTGVDELIVDGIRQPTIVAKLIQQYPGELIWLEVSTDERKRRYEKRKAQKDTQPFEVADNKAIELECQKIYSIFKEQITVINN